MFLDMLTLIYRLIYVDDFKLAGPKSNLGKGWKLIGTKIKMEAAQPIGRFLGCQQSMGSMTMHAWTNPRYAWIAIHKPETEPPILFDVRETEYE